MRWFRHTAIQDCTNPFALVHFRRFLPRLAVALAIAVPALLWRYEAPPPAAPMVNWAEKAEDNTRARFNGTAPAGRLGGGWLMNQDFYDFEGRKTAAQVETRVASTFAPIDLLRRPTFEWTFRRFSVYVQKGGQTRHAFDLPAIAYLAYAASPGGEWFLVPLESRPWADSVFFSDPGWGVRPALLRRDGTIVKEWEGEIVAGQFDAMGRVHLIRSDGILSVDLETLAERWLTAPDGTRIRSCSEGRWGTRPQERMALVLEDEDQDQILAVFDTRLPEPSYDVRAHIRDAEDGWCGSTLEPFVFGRTMMVREETVLFYDLDVGAVRGFADPLGDNFAGLVSPEEVAVSESDGTQRIWAVDALLARWPAHAEDVSSRWTFLASW